MTIIAFNQGAIKISEVAVDVAQDVFATGESEDALTLVNQIRQVSGYNMLRKSSFLLTSDGVVTWNGTTITNNGNNVFLRLNQNPTVGQVTIMIPTALLSTYTLSSSGQILYFQTSQSQLAGGSFTANSANIAVVADSSFPAALSTQTSSAIDQTITVPILARYDVGGNQSVWWVPHGIYWPQNTTSVVGSIITSTTNPVGSIEAWHLFGQTMPLGTPSASSLAPGYALCDGCVIVNINSSFNNSGRNSDGFPNVTYSPSGDFFTPSLNGPLVSFAGGVNYGRGDKVNAGSNNWVALSSFVSTIGTPGADPTLGLPATWSSGTAYTAGQFVYFTNTNVNSSGQTFSATYKAINNVGPSATDPFDDTANWQKYWGTDMTQNGNPFYRTSANNDPFQGLNVGTFIRGATSSPAGSGSYGGSNLQALTSENQLAPHNHGGANFASNSHNHTLPLGNNNNNLIIGYEGGNTWIFGSAGIQTHFQWFSTIGMTGQFSFGAVMATSGANNGVASLPTDGSSSPFDNQPRYFDALWIVKIY